MRLSYHMYKRLTTLDGESVGSLLGFRVGDKLGLDVIGTLHVESPASV